jgi:hypothetical protein
MAALLVEQALRDVRERMVRENTKQVKARTKARKTRQACG